MSDEAVKQIPIPSDNNPEAAYYSSLITSNLAYIEKQCYKAFGLYKTESSGFAVNSKDTGAFGMQTRKFREVTEADADAFFNGCSILPNP